MKTEKKDQSKILSTKINPKILDDFRDFCKENGLVQSFIIENLLAKYVQEASESVKKFDSF